MDRQTQVLWPWAQEGPTSEMLEDAMHPRALATRLCSPYPWGPCGQLVALRLGNRLPSSPGLAHKTHKGLCGSIHQGFEKPSCHLVWCGCGPRARLPPEMAPSEKLEACTPVGTPPQALYTQLQHEAPVGMPVHGHAWPCPSGPGAPTGQRLSAWGRLWWCSGSMRCSGFWWMSPEWPRKAWWWAGSGGHIRKS